MFKTVKKIMYLVAIACVVVGCAALASACNPAENGDNKEENTVLYSVTVTAEDNSINLSSLKAQWLKGEAVAAEQNLSFEGKASAELQADSYNVKLLGVPEGYSFANAIVTAENPVAAIEIKNDAPKTVTYRVSVSVPEGLTLPEEVAVQAFNGETAVGVPQKLEFSSSTIRAVLTVPYGSYTVKVINLPDYLTYEALSVTPDMLFVSVNLSLAEVEYEVGVTCENSDILSTLKVALYENGEAATEEKSLTEGFAKFTVTAGEYEVRLIGLDEENYEYEASVLIMTNRKTTVDIKAIQYIITVDLPENVSAVDFSQIVVKLTTDSGEDKTGVPDENGVAAIKASRGNYVVELNWPDTVDKEFNYVCDAELTAEVRETTIYVGEVPQGGSAYCDPNAMEPNIIGVPYEITATGRYYLAPELHEFPNGGDIREAHIHFTAPQTGLYTFTWTDTNILSDTFFEGYLQYSPIYRDNFTTVFVIDKDDDIKFYLDYINGDQDGFNVEITRSEPPVDGDKYKPFNATIGENTAKGRTEAYYVLPFAQSDHSFVVEFGEKLSLYHISNTLNNTPIELKNGDYIIPVAFMNEYIYAVAQDGAEIKFTLKDVFTPGSGLNPFKIELDKETEYEFSGYSNVWYIFTPSESGLYRVMAGQNFTSMNVYSSYISEEYGGYGDGLIAEITPQNPVNSVIDLTQDTKYYFELFYSDFAVSFKVIKFSKDTAQEGDPWKPKTADSSNTVDFTSTPIIYFKYTVQSDGYLVFTYKQWIMIEGVYTYFYSDEEFKTPIIGDIYDVNYQYFGDAYYWYDGKYEVKTGDTIYFYIDKGYSTSTTLTFEISVSPTVPQPPVFEISEGKAVDIILIPVIKNEFGSINEDIKLVGFTAGSYKLKVESLTPEFNPFAYVLNFSAGENTAKTEENFEKTSFELDLTIPANCDKLSVHVDDVLTNLYLRITLTKAE